MRFHNDTLEGMDALDDGGEVLRWNGFRIEEAAGIVELDLSRTVGEVRFIFRELRNGKSNLRRDGSARNRFERRVLPQIAIGTAPRTFAVRQENGRYGSGCSVRGPLSFDEVSLRTKHVQPRTSCGPFGPFMISRQCDSH